MALVNIDITGVASSTGPDDRVVLRAPMVREKTGGGLVSTREEVVRLVDGVGTTELEPGPVMVKFLCEGVSDTGEKLGVVPEAGPVDIFDVLADSLDYPAPVVQAAQRARSEALRYSEEAQQAATVAADEAVTQFTHATAEVWSETRSMADRAQGDASAAEGWATLSHTERMLSQQEALVAQAAREESVAARDRAEAAAWKAELTTVGVNAVESPPGSGLWIIGADQLDIIESPDTPGLYEIGVIHG